MTSHGVELEPPPRVPYPFSVSVQNSGGSDIRFVVSGPGSVSNSYHLRHRGHEAYLDLMTDLANDFGLRLPLNRMARKAHEPADVYVPLLTQNLTPKIVYGYGDPAILRVESEGETYYYVFSTSNDAPNAFPIVRSRDLRLWEPRGFLFPEGHEPAWASVGKNVADYWAPEVHRIGGEFRAYFVARHRATAELCIGVARAIDAEGPYVAEAEPLLMRDRIDPHVLLEDDGTAYLYWKEDRNAIWPQLLGAFLFRHPSYIDELFPNREDRITASLQATLWPWTRTIAPMEKFFILHLLIEAVTSDFSRFERLSHRLISTEHDADVRRLCREILDNLKTPVYVQRLSEDGLRLTGQPVRVLENDQEWEAHVIEGVWVTKYSGRYYLFYAGNDFSTADYGIGWAISSSPLGPFVKTDTAFLRSTPQWVAPGHASFALDPEGRPTLFLHAYFPSHIGYKQFRALLAVRLRLGETVSAEPVSSLFKETKECDVQRDNP